MTSIINHSFESKSISFNRLLHPRHVVPVAVQTRSAWVLEVDLAIAIGYVLRTIGVYSVSDDVDDCVADLLAEVTGVRQ